MKVSTSYNLILLSLKEKRNLAFSENVVLVQIFLHFFTFPYLFLTCIPHPLPVINDEQDLSVLPYGQTVFGFKIHNQERLT